MKWITIKSNTIDAAVGEILGYLEVMSKHEGNIYLHCWWGVGASSALRRVAQRLKSSPAQEMKFDKVVHVDCSLWQSMRALQKAIAEELELPQSVMEIFDQHDEEDDFNGIDQGSRGVIWDVTGEIFRKLANSTFVVIFQNGSNHYIDLYECGVPVTSILSNKVLWTWGRRLHFYHRWENVESKRAKVDVLMGCQQCWDHVLNEEAMEVAKCMGILEPDMIVECFQYVWAQRRASRIDWGTHASNYWVCDGIIQGQGDTSAWDVGDALQRNIYLDWIMEDIVCEDDLDVYISSPEDRWVSVTHQALLCDCNDALPPQMTSFFLLADEPDGRRVILPAFMFPNNNMLRVLHLYWCTFNFTSPPFLCCSHLRFILLDHCTDVREEEHQSNNQIGSCFQKLWVLDLRYTDWCSQNIMCLMDELRELNLEIVKDVMSIVDLCGARDNLVKLRVTNDPDSTTEIGPQRTFPDLSRTSQLKTIILDNCVGLEQVVPDVLPPSIESFSFIIDDDAIAKISSISVRGLAKLKSVLLKGCMESLHELDLSGTAVQTLNLRELLAQNLKRLILLGCLKLQAIQWTMMFKLDMLHIDTIRSTSIAKANSEEKANESGATTGSSSIVAFAATKSVASFDRYIFVNDARILRSLVTVEEYFGYRGGHVEMASSSAGSVAAGNGQCAQGIRHHDHYLYARDILFQDHLEDVAAIEDAIRWIWNRPPALDVDEFMGWYVHIQDEEEMKSATGTRSALIPEFICNNAMTLHVHDNFYITSIPFPLVQTQHRWSSWTCLGWCQVERCPKLSSVFGTPKRSDDDRYDDGRIICFRWLTTFWASQLPIACYIWNWCSICLPDKDSFEYLKFLHIDYCPKLIHVLPLSTHMITLPHLATLEVVCCGDLTEIFPLDHKRQKKQTTMDFPSLKHIHLRDLPRLHCICGSKMLAPNLKIIKIKGCWNLRRLPAVGKQSPNVDCEKDWWDNLEWDTGDANHHPSLYKPSHSRYYKKAQLSRGTVLR